MEIKEQVAKEIFEYDFTGFNPKWAECANKSHWLNLANKIIELFEQANPIQAGEDGLITDESISNAVFEWRKLHNDASITFDEHQELICKLQKALDDDAYHCLEQDIAALDFNYKQRLEYEKEQAKQKQAEAVKKVRDWIENFIYEEGIIWDRGIDLSGLGFMHRLRDGYNTFKQTLEELEEKK